MKTRRTKTHTRLLFLACAGICLFAGCARQQQFKTVDRICLPNMQKAQAMQITQDVLTGMHFTIAKADPNLGIIITKPLPGSEFFEFWREDSVGRFNTAEASMHTLRRTAHLDISQKDLQTCIQCNVKTEKLYLPQTDLSSSAQAFRMYGLTSRNRQQLELPTQRRYWVDMGADQMLSTKILNRISQCACRLQ